MRVRDLKGGAMFLFARVKGAPFAQGKNREPGAKAHSCACRKIPSGILPEGKEPSPVPFWMRAVFYKAALFFVRNLLLSRFFLFPGKRANCFSCVGTLLLTTKNPGCGPGEFHWYAKKLNNLLLLFAAKNRIHRTAIA